MKINCPHCHEHQEQEPIKTWTYGRMIKTRTKKGIKWGSSVTCSRYICKCGKKFNFYISSTNKTWTIPKSMNKSSKTGNNYSK